MEVLPRMLGGGSIGILKHNSIHRSSHGVYLAEVAAFHLLLKLKLEELSYFATSPLNCYKLHACPLNIVKKGRPIVCYLSLDLSSDIY